MWIPYGNLELHYWQYYFIQSIHFWSCIFIASGHELVLAGFMLRACHQIDLLSKRMKILLQVFKDNTSNEDKCNKETKAVSEIVKHHLMIYGFVNFY